MEAPHWTKIVFYLLVLPEVTFWLIVRIFHIHDYGAREAIGGFVGVATLIYAVHKLG